MRPRHSLAPSFSSVDAQVCFRFVSHLVGAPGWVECELDIDVLNAGDDADVLLNLLCDHRPDGTGGGGERHQDVHVALVLDCDIVHQAEVVDVVVQFRVVDFAEPFDDDFFGYQGRPPVRRWVWFNCKSSL